MDRDGARTQMMDWLLGAEARLAAAAELRRFGLDAYDPGDLLNDVVVGVLQADVGGPVDNPVGYARRALTNRARDLLGADKVRRRHLLPPPAAAPDDDGPADPLADVADPFTLDPQLLAAARAGESELRRRLHLALGRTKTWTVAAAMAALTLRLHDDVAVPDGVPVPEIGHRDKADRWAALWLAGERAAFPDPRLDQDDTPAMRKARSRKLGAVEALLHEVADAVLGGAADA